MMSAPGKTWRVFCAIELPRPTRDLVLQHIACLKAAVSTARASWSRDANLHLTLLDRVGVHLDSFVDSTGKIKDLFDPVALN